jgi:1,4-dihydroxy-2-naphthoyl-CoA hydrolase
MPVRDLAETLIGALGIEVLEATSERMRGRMPADARTIQPAGILHAGALASLADTLASWGTQLGIDPQTHFCVGQELSLSFLRPVPEGESVEGEALLVYRGRTSAVWEVRLRTTAGKLAAIARCTIAIRPQDRPDIPRR